MALAPLVNTVSTLYNGLVARLLLTFLSTFQATLDSRPITRFRSANNRGLLVYLALQSGRVFPREVLATLLWPEESEGTARNNLRQAIFQLRKVLGDLDGTGEPYVLATRQTLQFNPGSSFSLDVDQFLQATKSADLETAVAIYQGELLPGFTCDSELFEDWLRQEREYLHQTGLQAMSDLTQRYLQEGRLVEAQATARRQLGLEPWRELAHRQLMMALALAGDRTNALAQYEACRDVLWDELGVEPSAETVTLYEGIKAGDIGLPAKIASPEPPVEARHTLPLYATPIVGREVELATLDAYIADPSMRLVTIVGPGGVGKTRLGLAVAERALAAGSYPDGVFFIDLASLKGTDQILNSLADALGITLHQEDGDSSRRQIINYLRQKKILLIFDNFEHLLAYADLVADMLQSGEMVKVLVTSRERLHLKLEQVYPIEGLAFPHLETSDDAVEYAAADLFLRSARRNQPDFALRNRDEVTCLARICRLVSGMPLALELAASWVDVLSLDEIVTELQRGMDILETELRNVPERQRSVRASFDYSWQLLDEKEQTVFAQLSVFRGGFTRAAAQEVTGASLPLLSRLANKSLVRFDSRRVRYEVHELLRQYGADKLARQPQLEAVTHDHHSQFYCRMLAGYTDDLKGSKKAQALSAIEADLENVRLAWNHASSRQDLEAIGMALESLWRFYWDVGRRTLGEFEQAERDLRAGEAIVARGIVLGRLLAPLGRLYGSRGETARARALLEESLDLLHRLGTPKDRLIPLLFLAEFQESIENSNRLYQEGLTLAREMGDRWAIGHALLFLGWNARRTGDYLAAEQYGREALEQFRQSGDPGGIAFTLIGLSALAVDLGRYMDALTLAQESTDVTTGFNPMFHLPSVGSLGQALLALGRCQEAEEQFVRGHSVNRQFGRQAWAQEWLFWLGQAAFCKGDYALAALQYKESLASAIESKDLLLIVQNHNALGRLEMTQGDWLGAREHLQAALLAAMQLDLRPLLLECLASIAELFAEEGDMHNAASLAMLVARHSASRAQIKEQSARLLARIEAEHVSGDLEAVRQQGPPAALADIAAQLLEELAASQEISAGLSGLA